MSDRTLSYAFNVRGRKVLILGLGLHGGGAAAVRWFVRHGARVRVTDRQTAADLASTLRSLRRVRGVTYRLGRRDLDDVRWADVVVVNPGVPAAAPEVRTAQQLGKRVVNEATLFLTRCPAPIIAVTGTRGKTTTAHLIAAMLRAGGRTVHLSGNVRQEAMLDVLDRVRPSDWVVLELSSFQLELLPLVRVSPRVGVLTNLLVDHLNRHGTMARYGAIKEHLIRFQRMSDVAVLNHDDPWIRRLADRAPGIVCWYGQAPPDRHPWWVSSHRGTIVESRLGRTVRLASLRDSRLAGVHQRSNILAAATAARAAGIQPDAIRSALRRFAGVPYRQEVVRTWRGHRFINDTTATTPDGTMAALQVFPRALFIAGGTDKRLRFDELAGAFVGRRTALVLFAGTATERLLAALRQAGYRGPAPIVRTMPEAIRQAVRLARPGQEIVLSPGAASFGLFRHEFDRGDQFNRAVRRLR